MVIFGFRTKVLVLAMLTLLCPQCGNPAAHPLHKAVTKFTLFFIPLFPVRTRHTTQCTFCGLTSRVSTEQATQLLRQTDERRGQQEHSQQQYPPRR